MSDSKRTIEYVVEVIRKMPHQFPFSEAEKFTSLLNKRLDEILEIHKAEDEEIKTSDFRFITTLVTMYVKATKATSFSWRVDRNTMINVTVEKVEESEDK